MNSFGIRQDGTVVATGKDAHPSDLAKWTNIVAVEPSKNGMFVVGLKQDGSVTVRLSSELQSWKPDLTLWTDIVSVAAGNYHFAGLKKDGSIVVANFTDAVTYDLAGWPRVTALAAGQTNTLGIRKDGTVLATGANNKGQCDVAAWQDIVAVAQGLYHSIGLKRDGTLVATGSNRSGQCEVSGWTHIRTPS